MDKKKIISALLEKGDEYTNIDFSGFKKRVRDAMKMRGINQKETAQMVDVSEKLISQLVNECQKYSRPKDGSLERFFRQIDVLALALDVSPIWLKYNIGEMDNNAISFDEAEKDAAAVKDSAARVWSTSTCKKQSDAARVPLCDNLGIEDIARCLSSVALSLPDSLCNLCIRSCPVSLFNGDVEGGLELSLSIPLFAIDDEGDAVVTTEFGDYMENYFRTFIELKKIPPLILDNIEKENRTEHFLLSAFRGMPSVRKQDAEYCRYKFEREYKDDEPILVSSDGSLYQWDDNIPF